MLPVKVRRVFLAQHLVDFRKGADGLLGEAYHLGANPYDGIGLYMVTRRFEGGRLRFLERFSERPSGESITTGELSLLLEGARFTVHKRAGKILREDRKLT
jgi:hypothetical protein